LVTTRVSPARLAASASRRPVGRYPRASDEHSRPPQRLASPRFYRSMQEDRVRLRSDAQIGCTTTQPTHPTHNNNPHNHQHSRHGDRAGCVGDKAGPSPQEARRIARPSPRGASSRRGSPREQPAKDEASAPTDRRLSWAESPKRPVSDHSRRPRAWPQRLGTRRSDPSATCHSMVPGCLAP